jgi:hypothetical protein
MRKQMRYTILALFLLTLSVQAGAWTVKGVGVRACGEVINKLDKASYGQWLLGYISGKNYNEDASVGKGMSGIAIYEAAMKYCRENPLNDWADASEDVYQQLK